MTWTRRLESTSVRLNKNLARREDRRQYLARAQGGEKEPMKAVVREADPAVSVDLVADLIGGTGLHMVRVRRLGWG